MLILSILIIISCTAVTEHKKNSYQDSIFTIASPQAHFPGGDKALLKYLYTNLKFPETLREKEIKTKIVVRFTVDTIGQIKDPIFLKEISSESSKEVLKVLDSMPHWIPANRDGKKFEQTFTLPLNVNFD